MDTRISLSGSYGDIRFNHFHTGLDIRTDGVEGKPVISIQEGYVSRIKVERNGYGNALYITHPNGYTSLYAHLKEFAPRIKAQLLEREYAQRTWEIDTYFQAHELPIEKGEIIAFSGNTGGSAGPHLHFEIRNQEEDTIDPALFAFDELLDTKAPIIEQIRFVPYDEHSRIKGEFTTLELKPIRVSTGVYRLPEAIPVEGTWGLEVNAYDQANNSPFRLGLTDIRLLSDKQTHYQFSLESMPFDYKRDMNLHTNYEKMVFGEQRAHKCYIEEGNRLNLYSSDQNRGWLKLQENSQTFRLILKDSKGNQCFLFFELTQSHLPKVLQEPLISEGMGQPTIAYKRIRDVLKIEARGVQRATTALEVVGINGRIKIPMAYETAGTKVFLYSLKRGLPKTFRIEKSSLKPSINTFVSPNQPIAKGENYLIDFGDALYQNAYLAIQNKGQVLEIGRDDIPLKNEFIAEWSFPNAVLNEKHAVYLDGKTPKYIPSEQIGNRIRFYSKELGTYRLLEDHQAAKITPLAINASEISFRIRDNLSGINQIRCYLNGQWLMMKYEPKSHLIWAEKPFEEMDFKGQIRLEISDNCHNLATFEQIF